MPDLLVPISMQPLRRGLLGIVLLTVTALTALLISNAAILIFVKSIEPSAVAGSITARETPIADGQRHG
jgi:hypothetical protein